MIWIHVYKIKLLDFKKVACHKVKKFPISYYTVQNPNSVKLQVEVFII